VVTPTELLEHWLGKRWPTQWSAKLDRLQQRSKAGLLADSLLCLNELSESDPPTQQPGEVWTYAHPQPGDEYRWQTAALFADRVLVENPRYWEREFYFSNELSEALWLAGGRRKKGMNAKASGPIPTWHEAEQDSEYEALLAEIEEGLEEGPSREAVSEQFAEGLDGQVEKYVRFLVHLSEPLSQGSVHLANAVNPSWRLIVKTCCERYDDPMGGQSDFGQKLDALAVGGAPISEVVSSYQAGSLVHRDRICLLPSDQRVEEVAKLFVTHWRRLAKGIPISGIIGGPLGEEYDRSEDVEPDYRPALFERLALPALPQLIDLPPAAFGDVRHEARFAEFRADLRAWVGHVADAPNAASLEARLSEAQVLLSNRAKGVTSRVEELTSSKWKSISLQMLVGAAGSGLGFVTTGPVGVIAGAAAGAALGALLAKGTIDPEQPLTGTELALWTLTKPR